MCEGTEESAVALALDPECDLGARSLPQLIICSDTFRGLTDHYVYVANGCGCKGVFTLSQFVEHVASM